MKPATITAAADKQKAAYTQLETLLKRLNADWMQRCELYEKDRNESLENTIRHSKLL